MRGITEKMLKEPAAQLNIHNRKKQVNWLTMSSFVLSKLENWISISL